MILLDINFTLHGPDRDGDRITLYGAAEMCGAYAWTTESQFYLLSNMSFPETCAFLSRFIREGDVLKIQQVSGPFFLTGCESDAVASLLLIAEERRLIEIVQRSPAMLRVLGGHSRFSSLHNRTFYRPIGALASDPLCS